MTKFGVQMLGKLTVRCGERLWDGPENSKARELFCFLFSHPHSSFSREEIAERLWTDCDPFHSKKNLRQSSMVLGVKRSQPAAIRHLWLGFNNHIIIRRLPWSQTLTIGIATFRAWSCFFSAYPIGLLV
jgi:hypothetical protein